MVVVGSTVVVVVGSTVVVVVIGANVVVVGSNVEVVGTKVVVVVGSIVVVVVGILVVVVVTQRSHGLGLQQQSPFASAIVRIIVAILRTGRAIYRSHDHVPSAAKYLKGIIAA